MRARVRLSGGKGGRKMLGVKLICVGKMRERFYIDAFEEYPIAKSFLGEPRCWQGAREGLAPLALP